PQDLPMTLGFNTLISYGGAPRANSFDPATGTFDVPDVPPGEFTLQIIPAPQGPGARGTGTTMRLDASVPIHVTNADIDGLVLRLSAAATLQGKLIVE